MKLEALKERSFEIHVFVNSCLDFYIPSLCKICVISVINLFYLNLFRVMMGFCLIISVLNQ